MRRPRQSHLGRRPRRWLSGVLAAAFAISACQALDLPVGADSVFFPQPPPHVGLRVMMTALSSGTLSLENGCLWLKSAADTDLIIWPPSFRLASLGGGALAVLDGTGAKFADVGTAMTIGGGEVTSVGSSIDINAWVESKIGRTIPAICRRGRYWDAAGGPADAP